MPAVCHTGDGFSAEDAHRVGLVQKVTEPGQQLQPAVQIAETVADQAPLGVRATLASSRPALADQQQVAAARLSPDLAPIMASADAREGVQSFIERRPARFTER